MPPTLQEQLAAQGITMPQGDVLPIAAPPQGPNLQSQLMGAGLQVPVTAGPPMAAAPLPSQVPGESLRPPKMGPDVNVDYSNMPGGANSPRVGYTAPRPPNVTAPSINAPIPGAGGRPQLKNPYVEEEKAIDEARAGNAEVKAMRESDDQFNSEQMGKDIKQQEALAAQHGDIAKAHAEEASKAEEGYKTALDEFSKDKIDANHWWETRSAPQKVMGFIGAVLGGFVSGYKGRKDPFQESLDASIQQDIEAQKANHAIKGEALKGKQNAFGMMKERFKDDDAAFDATHALYLDRIALEGKQRAALTGNVDAQAAWRDQENRLAMQSAQLKDSAAAKAMAAMGGGFDKNKFQNITMEFVKNGVPIAQAQQQALAVMGTRPAGDLPGMGASPDKMAEGGKETRAAQTELNAGLNNIERAKGETGAITKGTTLGAVAAEHLPAWMPGVGEAVKNSAKREDYNNNARVAIGAAYKMGTSATEPKNVKLIEQYAKPYEITPRDTEETARAKMSNLQQFLANQGAAKGATSKLQSQVANAPPASFEGIK